MNYLLTDAGFYFTINQPTLDRGSIKGTWFGSLEALYDAVCERYDLQYDEIDGNEFIIENDRIYDDRGFCYADEEEMETPLETRINNFEI